MDSQIPNEPNNSSQPVPPQTSTTHRLRTLTIILLAVLLLSVVGIGAYFLGKNQQIQPQITQLSPTPTPDPTADWKTYTNSQYSFSFKYPENFSLKDEELNPGPNQFTATFKYTDKEFFVLDIVPVFDSTGVETFGGFPDSKTNITVTKNGITWNYDKESQFCDAGNCGPTPPGYKTIRGKYRYSFILYKIDSQTFNQILSTFRFD